MNKIDLHLHSNISDGTDSVEELLSNITKAGIEVFALTDHDTVEGCKTMKKIVPSNTKFISGIEFSCKHFINKTHILGLNIDIDNPKMKATINEGIKIRKEKLEGRFIFLKNRFNLEFSEEEKTELRAIPNCGTAHLAMMLLRKNYGSSISEIIDKYLSDFPKEQDKLDSKLAVESIHASGGLAIWAHPLGGGENDHISFEDFQIKLKEMLTIGIDGIECYYSRYSEEEEQYLISKAKENNLLISAGSDYHGLNKNVKIGQLNNYLGTINCNDISVLTKFFL